MTIVFSLLFGTLLNAPSGGVAYPAFALAALLPWTLFSKGLDAASGSLVKDRFLITKIYFPRLLSPASGVLVGIVDFFVALPALIVVLIYYELGLSAAVLTLPLFVLFALGTALGVGLWLSALNAMYRDVQQILPFVMQLWLFATPVAYSSDLIPDRWQALYAINPMVSVVDGFRWALLGAEMPAWTPLGISVAITIVLLVSGLFYFRRVETRFADVV